MARLKIEHRLGVQAPASEIWAVIEDLESWKDWNPLYPSVEGRLGFGATLTMTQALPGRKPEVIQPVVESWTPNELLHWRMKRLNGLIKSVRYLEIEKLTDTGSIFSNGELFEGRLTDLVIGRQRKTIRAGFQVMGEAVKARAEAAWREKAPAPTSSA